MALSIRNPETDRLAADLARLTGETKTEAVTSHVIGTATLRRASQFATLGVMGTGSIWFAQRLL